MAAILIYSMPLYSGCLKVNNKFPHCSIILSALLVKAQRVYVSNREDTLRKCVLVKSNFNKYFTVKILFLL